ncbi:hypothetical protein GCK32_019708 [Trichostrongylus colubriformis]|uniref:Uncharacterized protein n=1 Tax=Trichostrongylus colubriformis TaxID=6319 RepID=A0AAN8FLP0_TRICO
MRTGLLLLILTSCALAALYRLEAWAGKRVELTLGRTNKPRTWFRYTDGGLPTIANCSQPGCQPFPHSKLYENGSLIFEPVQESDSGMYSLDGVENVKSVVGYGLVGLQAKDEIVLKVYKPHVSVSG